MRTSGSNVRRRGCDTGEDVGLRVRGRRLATGACVVGAVEERFVPRLTALPIVDDAEEVELLGFGHEHLRVGREVPVQARGAGLHGPDDEKGGKHRSGDLGVGPPKYSGHES